MLRPAAAADSAEAQALLSRWLMAQNSGDFAAYQALYAADFSGIRRSGAQRVELDRDGWMRDRERMFKKPMQVDAKEHQLLVTPNGAINLLFTQTWASGTYKDVGRKQLVLMRKDGAYLISREEMLSSAIVPTLLPQGELGRYARLLTPDGPPISMEVMVLSAKHQVAVLLAGKDKAATEAVVGVLRPGDKPKLLARVALSLTGQSYRMPPLFHGEDKNRSVRIERMDLGEALPVIALYDVAEEVTDGFEHTVETLHLLRFTPRGQAADEDDLSEILTLQVNESQGDPECSGDSTSVELKPSSSKTQGLRDLAVVTRTFKSTLTMKRKDMICVPHRTKERSTYRFDGKSYKVY